MHDTDIDQDLRDLINAAMSVAGTPDDVRERVMEREEARIRENLEVPTTWDNLDDEGDPLSWQVEPGTELVPYEQSPLPVPYQPLTRAEHTFAAQVLEQFGAMKALWRAAPISFHSAAVQTEFALNLERLVTALEQA